MDPLIGVDELRAGSDATTLLDVRYRMGGPPGHREFLAGHLPGAHYVDLDRDLADPAADPVDDRGRHPLPDVDRFGEAMRRAGVREDRPVVVYDDWDGRAAARAWWLLRHHGHDDVRVLDGGWRAWQRAGDEIQTGETSVEPGTFRARPGRLPVVSADELLDPALLVLDARAGVRFRGEQEPVDPVAGHVPGARNVPTEENLDDEGRFLPAAALAVRYAEAGATTDREVAVYCGSGVTACHDLLALERAGISARLYPPSWSGWTADPERPVETGRG